MQLIRSGSNYYIWWGLDTGAEDQYPQVTIYEFDSATPIQTINFTHLVLGGYISSTALTYSGADLDVFGVAVVYSDAGHSVENTDYGREFPTFHIDDSSEFDNTADEVITDSASRTASQADVSGLSTFDGDLSSLATLAEQTTQGTKISNILKALINTKFLDDVNYKIIIYDDDGTTPLYEFYTKNAAGDLSTSAIKKFEKI